MKNDGKFVKIQDGVIIKRESLAGYKKKLYDPRGVHFYVALYSKKKRAYDMYPTSHYVDPSKSTDVRNGRAILMNIKGANGLSTVYKIPRTKDVNGQLFQSDSRMIPVGTLTPYQIKRLRGFTERKNHKSVKK